MTTPQPDDTTGRAAFEQALAEAMHGFTRQFEPPHYPPGTFRARPRRTPRWLTRRSPALMAATSVLVLGATAAVSVGVYRLADSPSPGSGAGVVGPHPWTGPSIDNPGPVIAMNTVFNAAVEYQNPATAARVDLAMVKNFFKDDATFARLWGRDSLGVTCGQHTDSYTIRGGGADLFAAGRRLPVSAAVVFTGDETRIADILCP